ncbi:hypothetical protein [Terriglobus roseus]|uniref:Uncharacterized protein n=1 Tax=Terriglobus roseus TaxID=392734 RepID=A0A1H4RTU6_9BACT|nr:hypothetical protein [Terriglobus roseus]SEC35238.1 hypothetical protein SAMN05443244_3250 [Terriglobus roseus]
MSNAADEKFVPNEPKPAPAMDANRAANSNLAPQGKVDLSDQAPGSNFTPEGDQEDVPNIAATAE